jgi:phenylacetate-CoA ligase
MRIVRNRRARSLAPLIDQQSTFYSQKRSAKEIQTWQLACFQENWTRVRKNVPYYAQLGDKVPAKFDSWDQFKTTVPLIDRKEVQQHGSALADRSRPADFLRTTGGSTSEPVQLPAWNSELEYANADFWLARSWLGISPSDKLFLIWGHSHLLGSGLKGKLNGLRRTLKDALLGYYRFSAYDLSPQAMQRAGDALLDFRPAYVIGYSVALDAFAQANAERAEQLKKIGLKAVIATAEAFPTSDSRQRISEVLGSPVVMEYGAVESGPIAQETPGHRFQVFWKHWYIETIPSEHLAGAFDVLLTSLYPRCFPLIRYRTGDLISEDSNSSDFEQTFERVIGRCNDFIQVKTGALIHSEAFTHAVKECAFVMGFQVVQCANGDIRFNYVPAPRCAVNEAEIRRRLTMIHPALGEVTLSSVQTIPQTIAGKTRAIVREQPHAK